MRAIRTSKAPCSLNRGEIRRVPQDLSRPVIAYHFSCPRCQWRNIAIQGHDDVEIADETAVSFSKPIRCLYCRVLIRLQNDYIDIEEDGHVRNV